MQGQLHMTRGLPGSGKTTFARNWVREYPQNRARINRDDLRAMLFNWDGGKLTYDEEKTVTQAQRAAVVALLNGGYDVMMDDTNLQAKNVKEWYSFIEGDIVFHDIDTAPQFCIDNVHRRVRQGGRNVPDEVIIDYANRFMQKGKLPPQVARPEASEAAFAKYVPEIGLPHAVIFDIDGTLAHSIGRGPFDETRYHEDELDFMVRELLFQAEFIGLKIVVMSGRKGTPVGAEATIKWLELNGITADRILMRGPDDDRNDAITKNELFEKFVAPNYYVDYVVDDRNRVVNMWRAKGLLCLQVADGNF